MIPSGVIDNHKRGSVIDFLKDKLAAGSEVSIVSAFYTIYAHEALKQELDSIGELRFLYGDLRAISHVDPDRFEKTVFHIDCVSLALKL